MINQRTISAFDLARLTGITIAEIYDVIGNQPRYSEEDVLSNFELTQTQESALQIYFDSLPVIDGRQRRDLDGLFWQAQPKTKTIKPIPVWEAEDYVPFLDEAKAWQPVEYTDRELVDCSERLLYDIEVYANYCLIAFEGIQSGKQCFFELSDFSPAPNYKKLQYIIDNKQLISFNGINFDATIMSLFMAGKTVKDLQRATDMLIMQDQRAYEVLKHFKIKPQKIDQIDIMELCIGQNSLKLYGARLHCKSIIDLPFKPGSVLTQDKALVVKYYCANDLSVTKLVYEDRLPAIVLREAMSDEYKVDLRSKSDAQVAEAIIASEFKKITGRDPEKSEFQSFTFRYQVPDYVNFKTQQLQDVLEVIRTSDISTGNGKIECPPIESLKVTIGSTLYIMGLGGIHAAEENKTYYANEENGMVLIDIDAASFYPKMIINQRLSPPKLGSAFLNLYENRIFYPRLEAKKRKDKVKDGMFKIVLNGSFGKFGSKFSTLYAPRLLAQVTLSGQLTLLMLVERLELVGISVIQANTDGIVVHCKQEQVDELREIIKRFERHCGMIMEETHYSMLCNRDVNNYVAIKTNGEVKLKGTYAESNIGKNPVNTICNEAVVAYLTTGKRIEDTVAECNDIRKFLTLRNVKGGACKDNVYLGKTVRWYHSNSTLTSIVYANSGNNVPMSDKCRALQWLPDEMPDDVDKQWYVQESYRILKDIGAI